MSDKTEKTPAPAEATVASTDESLKAVIPANTVLSGQTLSSLPWFNPWVPQTFAGSVVSGIATPTITGTGYAGQNVTGFVYQNDQYNTSIRGF